MNLVRTPLLLSALALTTGCMGNGSAVAEDRSAPVAQPEAGSDLLLEALGAKPDDKYLLEPKIIGGEFAKEGDNPWQVALVPAAQQARIAFCGGSLISRDWVLTAAHCVDKGTRANQVDVVTGSVDLEKGTRLSATKIVVHPGWNPITHDNDLALVKLATPVGFVGVPMITKAEDTGSAADAGTSARVSGWGATAMRGGTIRNLKFVEVPIVDRGDCNDRVSYGGAITDNMICAGRQNGGADSCQGDSGGPLTIDISGRRVLIGVVSWGRGCALPNKYGVYARVANYLDWIAQNRR